MALATKILIVEDEEVLAGNLKAYLERSSCVARVAPDGASAIDLAETFSPECMVLDFRLPDMDGFEALDCIRDRCGRFPCVLITGHPTSEVFAGAARRGIDHILFKPFPLAELSNVVLALAAGALPPPADTPRVAAPGRATAPGYAGEERRHNSRSVFPMRLFDGSWLFADRRHPAGVKGRGGKLDS